VQSFKFSISLICFKIFAAKSFSTKSILPFFIFSKKHGFWTIVFSVRGKSMSFSRSSNFWVNFLFIWKRMNCSDRDNLHLIEYPFSTQLGLNTKMRSVSFTRDIQKLDFPLNFLYLFLRKDSSLLYAIKQRTFDSAWNDMLKRFDKYSTRRKKRKYMYICLFGLELFDAFSILSLIFFVIKL